jgi:hypothetical protein
VHDAPRLEVRDDPLDPGPDLADLLIEFLLPIEKLTELRFPDRGDHPPARSRPNGSSRTVPRYRPWKDPWYDTRKARFSRDRLGNQILSGNEPSFTQARREADLLHSQLTCPLNNPQGMVGSGKDST